MAYNTKNLKKDAGEKPIPQVFNPEIDDYEALEGKNGASKSMLVSDDGGYMLTKDNPAYIRDNRSDLGLHINRPAANQVRAGFVYYSVDTDELAYSDGASWVVM